MTATLGLAEFERGLAAQRAGEAERAIAAYRTAVAAAPTLAPAHFNLGQLLRQRGEVAAAAVAFDAAVRLRPDAPDAWINLGVCREQLGDLDTAAACYHEASRLAPHDATAHFNAGNVLRKQGNLTAAVSAFEAAASRMPDAADVWLNLGNARREAGRFAEALAAFDRADALKPAQPEVEWNRALTELASGRLHDGWRHYDSRWARLGRPRDRGLPWNEWRGEPVQGTRILVWPEQGLGDEMLFATCVPDLVALGAEVTLALDPRLVDLYSRAWPDVVVVPDGAWGSGSFDWQIPLGGLPRYLRPSRTDFRPQWSQLVPARAQLVAWGDRLKPLGPGLRVGINWRSGLRGTDRRRYYAALQDWRPIFEVPGVELVNLQYDDCREELETMEHATGRRVHRWPAVDLKQDLESVAALAWHLDLVIAAPTAVTSLAGAVGTETWQVDPGNDWTVFGEERSPWFPAVRLFRKPYGDRTWSGTLNEVARALSVRVAMTAGARARA